MKNKKSQVTIFIILGLIIVVVIVMLFLLIKAPETKVVDEDNPQAFIDACTKQAVEEALEILMSQGGDINPKLSVMHDSDKLSYLCYHGNYYMPCINQKPMLINHIENEITNYIEPKIESCFQTLKLRLEKKYDIEMNDMQIITKLQPDAILIIINREFKMLKGDSIRSFENFKTILIHPIYDLAEITLEIINQEAKYCNFDILGYMIMYPQYDLNKFRTSDSDIIYSIKEIASNQEFKFAIRSCALPPGF